MRRSYAVALPRNKRALFPDCCVFCRKKVPGASTRVIARDGSKGRNIFAGWFSVVVPCCRVCGWRLQLARLWRFVRTVVVGFGSCALALWVISGGDWKNLKQMGDSVVGPLFTFGFVVLCIAAVVVWEKFFPPAFTVEPHDDDIEYKFRNYEYADQFADINRASVL